MSFLSPVRSLGYYLSSKRSREIYWDLRESLELRQTLKEPRNSPFKDIVERERLRLWTQIEKPTATNQERLDAAVEWILRAQRASLDDGVPVGYFPLTTNGGWSASYPETTGYIITSLLDYSRVHDRSDVRERALAMARWEVDVQMPSGAVQGGPVCPAERQTPAAFNTGMVLDGWSAAYRATGDRMFLEAGYRAATFLVDDLDSDGYFRTNGRFVSDERIKTYTCLCAWAMYRFGEDTAEERLVEAAIRAVEAAVRQQNEYGWFAHCCLTDSRRPLTHTIGYTLQGILEVGLLAGRDDFIAVVEKSMSSITQRVERDGYLPGRLDWRWRPSAQYACLTGSAQLAVVAYRLCESRGRRADLLEAANRLTDFVKATQVIDTAAEPFSGAIAGSYPILGGYMRAGYPNWATKYFIDALMLEERLVHG